MGIRPDLNDEDIGIRSFHLQREKAVERAVEKIRQKTADNWKDFGKKDIEILHWTLGEVWSFAGRHEWEEFPFSALTLPQVLKIIHIGDQILNHEKKGYQGFEEIHNMLKKL